MGILIRVPVFQIRPGRVEYGRVSVCVLSEAVDVVAFGQLLESLIKSVDAGRWCALCTIVSTRGSTPQTAGASLLLHADGTFEGTIGGGCIEAQTRQRAFGMAASGESGLLSFRLDRDRSGDDGLICGGEMDIAVVPIAEPASAAPFREAIPRLREQRATMIPLRLQHEGRHIEYRMYIEPTPTLLIAGAGHVGAALAKLAVTLDYRVVVVDDRSDLLRPGRFESPIECVAGDVTDILRGWPIDANTYVVVATRDHRNDEQALHAVIDSPARYIGMIGSRRKINTIFDDLTQLGVDRAGLERVHSPIGLKIGAVTVPEIAVSIAAELIQVRRADKVTLVEGPVAIGAGG